MIKLIDILKETYLGGGEQGKVYAIDKNKVKKQSNFSDGFTQDELYFYNQFNKHPNIFPNKSIDFHASNIGVDNNGDLKIFDLAI